MTHVNDLHLLVMQDGFGILQFIYIVFLLNLIFSMNYCLHLTTILYIAFL
jgi:hypothetical protein